MYLRELQANQLAELEAWYEALVPHRDELNERLGISAAEETTVRSRAAEKLEPQVTISRRSVYRVRRNRDGEYGILGFFLGAGLAVLFLSLSSSLLTGSSEAAFASLGVFPIIGAVAGALLGRKRPKYFCSAWYYGAPLDGATEICTSCGGRIDRDIAIEELDAMRLHDRR